MNKFIKVTFKGVLIAALVGTVAACSSFPFLGRNRSANQVEPTPEGTTIQPAGQARLSTGQPGTQGGTTTAQAPQTTEGQGGALPDESTQADGNQPVPALW